MADIRACALHVYIHVLVDRLNIWSTSVGWRDLGRCCMIFLYIGLSFRPKLHIKSWTMTKKSTFFYDKWTSFHDIASIPCFFWKTSNCTFGVFHERPQNLRSFDERPQKLGWLEYQGIVTKMTCELVIVAMNNEIGKIYVVWLCMILVSLKLRCPPQMNDFFDPEKGPFQKGKWLIFIPTINCPRYSWVFRGGYHLIQEISNRTHGPRTPKLE